MSFKRIRKLCDFVFQFSGTPLSGAKRLQLSWDVKPLEEVEIMSKLQEMLLPMMWIEEGVQLNKTFVNMLKYQLILLVFLRDASNALKNWHFLRLMCFLRALQFQDTVKYGSIFGGLAGLIATGVAFYLQSEAENETAVISASAEKKSNIENQSIKSVGLSANGIE